MNEKILTSVQADISCLHARYLYLELGKDINSLALVWICASIAVRRSSGRLIDGCLVNVKFNSLRS